MDFLLITSSLLVLALGLAILTNRARSQQKFDFELKPNCLLTRWPLVFITGPRSLFYFSTYWNQYTVFLAEHGYEVFTLHLPWNDSRKRQDQFQQFLSSQEKAHRHFHFFIDQPTFIEFEHLLRNHKSEVIKSFTKITGNQPKTIALSQGLKAFPLPIDELQFLPQKPDSMWVRLSYYFHQKMFPHSQLPQPSTLGASSLALTNNCHQLLERAQTLAEMDLQQNS